MRKLHLVVAFSTLLLLAFAAGCRGFFVNPALTSIAVSPTAPQVQVGKTVTLQAFGTYDDGSRKLITSGVTWTSDSIDVATINGANGVLTGVSPGQSTITASAQALEGTATATVLLTGVTSITVEPTSGSVSPGGSFDFAFTATAGGFQVPLTTDLGADLTISPATSNVTCAPSGDVETCTADSSAALGAYTITMTYPGSTASARATLNVQ